MDRFIISIGYKLINLVMRFTWSMFKTCAVTYYSDEDPFHSNNQCLNLLVLLGRLATWGFILYLIINKLS
ncbi:hypothetical protein CVH13_00286 [Dehalococcoides mccartyi]|jgi:hypothetical protein|uniref:Uncharacterized protein n=1 Tax=Dehalococcoides mccartyi TaxID=61435 RepID=A0A2J1E021_9CHLR|nr:hypothetical protein CVH13_00286 [Dehalococcoides mccartyi]